MPKNCVICNEAIEEEYGKLNGTIIRVCDENKQSQFIHVCSECQGKEGWIEIAKVKSRYISIRFGCSSYRELYI